MKNINLTLSPFNSYAPAPMPPFPPVVSPAPIKPTFSVGLSVQFEDEEDSLAYAKFILEAVQTFKQGDR